MDKHTPAETSEWVAENLRSAQGVSKVEVLLDQLLRVSRNDRSPFVAGIVSVICVEADTVRKLVKPALASKSSPTYRRSPIGLAEPLD
jgi:hypothetical protein